MGRERKGFDVLLVNGHGLLALTGGSAASVSPTLRIQARGRR